MILDIADKGRPTMISRFDYHPPMRAGFTHTVLPLFARGLLLVTDEAMDRTHGDHPYDGGWDHPKLVWLMDAREETNLVALVAEILEAAVANRKA